MLTWNENIDSILLQLRDELCILFKKVKIIFKIDQTNSKYWKIQRKPKTEVLYGGSNL